MRFYNQQHRFYCGVDLHARTMYLCIRDQTGAILFHKNLPAQADAFLDAIAPYRDDLVVGCECMFAWYWLSDLCAQQKIPFVLGHALYLKAIHGGKTQGQRRRALDKFKTNQVDILVATDVAARGIDVADITHVINYTLPQSYDDYIHRIGRAGRAGRIGYAFTFVTS